MLLGLKEKKREQGKNRGYTPGAMEQWQEAERYFKSVSDTDLVDYAVFEMEAARRKYMLLLKRYAEERQIRGVERYNAGNAHHVWDRYTYGVGHMQDLRMAPQDTFQAGDKRRYGRYRAAGNKHNRQRGRLYAPITALTALLVGLLGVPGVVLIALWVLLM